MEPAVKYYGVRTIDYIFLSHADKDHISGIQEYLENYKCGFGGANAHGVSVRNIVLPPSAAEEDFETIRSLAAEKGIAVQRLSAGGSVVGGSTGNSWRDMEKVAEEDADNIVAGGASTTGSFHASGNEWEIRCLSPDASALTGDKNEDSMVLMLTYGKFRMLFTGDLEGEAEKRLIERAAVSGVDLDVDVLKTGHHGSAGASSEAFLAQVQPETAVISCGRNNSYGHPSQAALDRLADAGSDVYVTAWNGAVKIVTDGKTYTVEGYNSF
jgi:competence protein ComEC